MEDVGFSGEVKVSKDEMFENEAEKDLFWDSSAEEEDESEDEDKYEYEDEDECRK